MDKGGMLENLSRFPESCKEAIDAAERLPLNSLPDKELKAVVVAGVGGSAIGGLLISDWLKESCTVPIHVPRSYHLPKHVSKDTLVFAVSYSGNTQETLSALREALERNCPVVVLTSGGEMQRIATERCLPLLPLPGGMQPRAALPNQFFSLATVMRRLGLASEAWGEVPEAFEVLEGLRDGLAPEAPVEVNTAKRLALGLTGLVPFIYGPRLLEAVAYRISTELNENSKVPAASGFFPEAFHNAVMGCEGPKRMLRCLCVLIIRDPEEPPGMRRKVDSFRELLGRGGVRVLELMALGRGRLARMLSALYTGDYVSTYLGLLYGLDPSSTTSIDALKTY